jgi:hypothetical protein
VARQTDQEKQAAERAAADEAARRQEITRNAANASGDTAGEELLEGSDARKAKLKDAG